MSVNWILRGAPRLFGEECGEVVYIQIAPTDKNLEGEGEAVI